MVMFRRLRFMSRTRWLDFSGAPPLVIAQPLVRFWRGTTDPRTGKYREFNGDNPVTDYDRACVAAWPGRGILEFRGSQVLALYTEFDLHSWDSHQQILACGGWWPSKAAFARAEWLDPIEWHAAHDSLLLFNSAADGTKPVRDDDFVAMPLRPGSYTITTSCIESEYVGYFHRFL